MNQWIRKLWVPVMYNLSCCLLLMHYLWTNLSLFRLNRRVVYCIETANFRSLNLILSSLYYTIKLIQTTFQGGKGVSIFFALGRTYFINWRVVSSLFSLGGQWNRNQGQGKVNVRNNFPENFPKPYSLISPLLTNFSSVT